METRTGSDVTPAMSQRARWLIIAALAVAMLLGAWWMNQRPLSEPVEAGAVTTISSIDQLAAAFNADVGRPRVILLFSPT
jgi:hypothetical protein